MIEYRCIPITTIFPPATLSIENARENHTSNIQVPQFDFATFNYVAPLYDGEGTLSNEDMSLSDKDDNILWRWNGPSRSVQHIALAVLGLGQILPVSAPTSNASWTLDFWGPALACNDVAKTERDRTWLSIWNSYNGSNIGPYAFLSWVPWSRTNDNIFGVSRLGGMSNESIPWQYDLPDVNVNLPFLFNSTSNPPVVGPPTDSLTTNGFASFFIATFPEAQNFSLGQEAPVTDTSTGNNCNFQMMYEITDPGIVNCALGQITAAQYFENSTLLRCDLVNTSYSVDFSYTNGAQDIHISSNTTGNATIMNSTGLFLQDFPLNLNLSLPTNCSSFLAYFGAESPGVGPCVFDLDSIRQLSYQGIMAAFNGLVLGSVQRGDGSIDTDTSIMRTILATTKELAFLGKWRPNDGNGRYYHQSEDLPTFISQSTGWAYPGLVNPSPSDTDADLKSTLERLFQNYTISLLAEPLFQ